MTMKDARIERVYIGQFFYWNGRRYIQLIIDEESWVCRAYCYDTDELENILFNTEVKVFNIFK